jgi:NADPH2:quinone reductase
MNETIRVLRLHELGYPAQTLRIERIRRPTLRPDEVGIRVHAFALNRADWLYARGLHYTAPELPSRIGSECAGVVEEVGSAVQNIRPGDKVASVPFNTTMHGVQGEYAVVPERYVAPWPEELSAIEATSIWMQYLTAYFAFIEVGQLTARDNILITAASSSAGLAAVQLAKLQGATVIATTRSSAKASLIHEAGADTVVVVDEHTDLAGAVLEASGEQGVRIVYDPVAGPFMRRYLEALAPHARIFIYGLLSGQATELDIVPLVRRAAIVHPYSMFNHVSDPEQLRLGIGFVLDAVREQGLRPRIGKVFGFEESIRAYEELDADSHYGKIVVNVAGLA